MYVCPLNRDIYIYIYIYIQVNYLSHILVGRLITNILRKDKQKIIWYNLIIRKLSVKCLFLNNWEMPKRWIIIDSCYAVVFYPPWPLQCYLGEHISYFLCCMQKCFPFPLFRMQQIKGNSRHMHAGFEDVTNKITVCQTLSLMLMIDGLTLLYNWHYWYQCCEIWDLSALADKVGIVFETS